ncbi:MAG: hypothetical protein LBJ60_04995 [Tannerellaceae bacterium]|jgi:hypothetical protein|nr:hypothetical protein [Tannerellaceae bacterium]
MKRFFKKIILLGLLFGCSILLFLIILVIIPVRNDDDFYLAAFHKKQEALVDKHHQKRPSVILLGGSNVAFGFNSKLIEEALHLPVINTGLHAGLGLKFMLDHTSEYLTEGDVLVIAPEYSHFFGSVAYGGGDCLVFLYHYAPRISKYFNARQFNIIINYIKDVFLNLIFPPKVETNDYKASGFNEYGDYAKHWTMPPIPYEQASPSDFKTINADFLDYYENTVAALRSRGIQVVIIPPSISETSYNIIEDRLTPLFSEFEKRNLAFAISPQASMYPDSLFFDTHYHLKYEGVLIRTNQLIELMKKRR